ncbi:40S small subunit processome assembly factor 1 [Gouania willdenowi]|uniref:Ribosomal RNA-processing protein 7 C-terminal domain-containing protein n=1 Tax=Gouania willdenowi TaxID=441366 RepID=A0A8C5I6E4_GOUWI|nr:uncharacterized protein C1orf131 homolog [Gouania willdenowi]
MSSDTIRTEDDDHQFLERVLNKLYDFGSTPKKSQKKKKRKMRKDDDDDEEEDQPTAALDVCSHSASGEEHASAVVGGASTHRTCCSEMLSQQENQVEVVTFQDPRKKLKNRATVEPENTTLTEKNRAEHQEELSLEKARLEVHRFGITGYKKEQQRGFEQERAVMLGARPPKKDYVNYKTLQQRIRDKKQKVKEDVEPELKKKKKKKNPRDQKKKSSSSGSSSAPSGQVGRFKNGLLVLSSKEIQKIKSKRGK